MAAIPMPGALMPEVAAHKLGSWAPVGSREIMIFAVLIEVMTGREPPFAVFCCVGGEGGSDSVQTDKDDMAPLIHTKKPLGAIPFPTPQNLFTHPSHEYCQLSSRQIRPLMP